ncbi:hypothetical protein AWA2013_31120 (plasmid) [Lactiplantibacillus plantarum]|nr:hypothetical protein AWA2013_31120 [Lactiplantibacillus plantarum]
MCIMVHLLVKKEAGKEIAAELLSQYGVSTFSDDKLSIATVMPFIDKSFQSLLKKYS